MNETSSTSNYASSIQAGKLSVLEHFWEHSNDNIFIVVLDEDGDFVIEDFNPAQVYNFGVSDGFRGKKLKSLVDEVMLSKVEARYKACIADNKPHNYDESHEFGEKIRHWNTMVIPVLDSDDGKVRIFGIAREMTSLVNAKESLSIINESLEQVISERTLELKRSNEILQEKSQKLEDQAYTDPLTQIGNRRYFFKWADVLFSSASMKSGSTATLIYADLDDFKVINDTYGHTIGDAILIEFVGRVQRHIRNSDIFSRFGGEEFVLLIPNTSLDISIGKAQEILKSIANEPFIIDGKIIDVTSSIGIAMGKLSESFDLDKLIGNADKALYTAKRNGKNQLEVYQA